MNSRRHSAFSLVELLVVIAIIAMLTAILLPALAGARKTAQMTRELCLAKEQTLAWQGYASDYKDSVVPAGPAWASVQPMSVTPPDRYMRPPDLTLGGPPRLEDCAVKVWFWHMFSYSSIPYASTQTDAATRSNFLARPADSTPGSMPGNVNPGADSRQAAFAWHPSLGMNGVFVGGSYSHGAFTGGNYGGSTTPAGDPYRTTGAGRFFVRRTYDCTDPAALMVFCSSRGGDVREGNWWGFGQTVPDTGVIRPGYWIVTPPFAAPNTRGGYGLSSASSATPVAGNARIWVTSNKFNAASAPGAWGMVDPRHRNTAITASVDGHARSATLEDLRDARRWSTYATAANWTFSPRP